MRSLLQSGLLLAVLWAANQPGSGFDLELNVKTARSIHANLNRSMEPCSDFWGYACSNWTSNSNFTDNFEQVEHKYAQAMAAILSGDSSKEQEAAPRLMQQLRDYYAACSREPNLKPQLDLYLRDVPVELQAFKELFLNGSEDVSSTYDWVRATAELRRFGLNNVYFEEAVDVAYNDSLQHVVRLQMRRQNIYFGNLRIARLIIDAGLSGLENSEWPYEAFEFEEELISLCKRYRSAEPELESWSLEELQRQIPQINWKTYFKVLLGKDVADLRFEVSDVEYFRRLGELLQRTKSGQIHSYLWLRLLDFLYGAKPRQLTSERCVEQMRALLPLGMNYVYDRKVYQTRSQDSSQLGQVFDTLRAVFGKYLEGNRLQLKEEEMAYLRAKLAAMQLRLGNLPEETDVDFYNNHYASANFSSRDFIHNNWQAWRLRTQLQHAKLLENGGKVQLRRYYVNDDVIKARSAPYFEHERNTMTIPLIFLQFPFFDYRQHVIFQHSLAGGIMAHELIHAFEQQGVLFDAAGNETPLGEQLSEDGNFKAAVECARTSSPPTASLKERLADLNGLQMAYDSFFGLRHNSSFYEYRPYEFDLEKIPAPQLFFLNYAQFFCGRLPTAIDHDPDDVRVNTAVEHIWQFATDFNCTAKQKQPVRCEMWRPA